MGCLLVVPLKGVLHLSSSLSFPIIQIGLTLEIDIAYLVDFLEKLIFCLNLALSFFDLAKLKELQLCSLS